MSQVGLTRELPLLHTGLFWFWSSCLECLYQAANLIETSVPLGGSRSHDLLVISQITVSKRTFYSQIIENDSALPLSYKGIMS
jgi:hypothetical protein